MNKQTTDIQLTPVDHELYNRTVLLKGKKQQYCIKGLRAIDCKNINCRISDALYALSFCCICGNQTRKRYSELKLYEDCADDPYTHVLRKIVCSIECNEKCTKWDQKTLVNGARLRYIHKTSTYICSLCGGPGKWICAGCNIERYCSEECQRLDWKLHQTMCSARKSGKSFSREPISVLRAISEKYKYFTESKIMDTDTCVRLAREDRAIIKHFILNHLPKINILGMNYDWGKFISCIDCRHPISEGYLRVLFWFEIVDEYREAIHFIPLFRCKMCKIAVKVANGKSFPSFDAVPFEEAWKKTTKQLEEIQLEEDKKAFIDREIRAVRSSNAAFFLEWNFSTTNAMQERKTKPLDGKVDQPIPEVHGSAKGCVHGGTDSGTYREFHTSPPRGIRIERSNFADTGNLYSMSPENMWSSSYEEDWMTERDEENLYPPNEDDIGEFIYKAANLGSEKLKNKPYGVDEGPGLISDARPVNARRAGNKEKFLAKRKEKNKYCKT